MIKEKELLKIGFVKTKEYRHDEYRTNRYELGALEVEITFDEHNTQVSSDVTIEEVNCLPVLLSELKELNKILNKKS